MQVPILNRFLCCMTVRTGALVVGWLSLAYSVMMMASMVCLAVQFDQMQEDREQLLAKVDPSTEYYIGEGPQKDELLEISRFISFGSAVFWILFTLGITKALIDMSLLIGIFKKNHYFMLPWLIIQFLGCVVLLGSFVILVMIVLFSIPQYAYNYMEGDQFATLILGTMSLILNSVCACYIYLVVYSTYVNIKKYYRDNNCMIYVKM